MMRKTGRTTFRKTTNASKIFQGAKESRIQMVPLAENGASPARTKKKTLHGLARCGRAVS
jgi:hypothetical protein